MNKRIRLLAEQAKQSALDTMIKIADREQALKVYSETYDIKFAQLIIAECASVLFDESEKLFELGSEEASMSTFQEEYELRSDQCVNNITLIEKHFGVEE